MAKIENSDDFDAVVKELCERGYSVVDRRFSATERIKFKLGEQGTQRGLMLLIPILLERAFHVESSVGLQIVEGCLALYGTHNIVTKG